jgi:YesN/AraC family two-component response regulator
MFYVFRGQCTIQIKNKKVILKEGDYIIIAPQTVHSIISDNDNFILDISIKKSNFESLYHQIISEQNILAIFFRNIVCMKNSTGYLLFHTENNEDIKYIIKNMALETLTNDEYNFWLSNYWLTILLTHLIRDYYLTMESMPKIYNNELSYIIQYIINNYRTITLNDLVNQFGYTKPYLCQLIKEQTGYTFTYLVNLEKVNNATILLKEHQYSIEYISHYLGYNSATHFSRTFKKYYGLSPIEYRKQNIEQ